MLNQHLQWEIPDFLNRESTLFLLKSEDIKLLAKWVAQVIRDAQPEIPAPTKEEKPFTQDEAIKFFGKSRQTLIAWRKKGYINAYRISGRIYYKPSELVSALEKLGS